MFLTKSEVAGPFRGSRVAIVGSGPSCLQNELGFIDSHDIVVRINNYKLFPQTGYRTDVFYSFFGSSVKKSVYELRKDGVRLCMCKCPNERTINSEWHRKNRKELGVDFRYIYRNRKRWWFSDVYIPQKREFMEIFESLGEHIPTTGFSCIRTIADFDCSIFVTGFDFFSSRMHNVDEPWRPGNQADPIRHAPERELEWLRENRSRFQLDDKLRTLCTHTEESFTPTT